MRYLMLIWFCLLPIVAYAEKPVFLTSMRIMPAATKTTIIFDLTDNTQGVVKFFPQENLLVIKFSDTKLRFNVQQAKLKNANVMEFSGKELSDNSVEFRMKTTGKVKWTTAITPNSITNKTEMRLEIQSILPANSAVIVDSPKLVNAVTKNNHVISPKKQKCLVLTVVIDAGHGGKDSGAVGKNGVREKDVVLSIAKKLAIKLESIPGVRVLMTRKGDYYVPLRERLNLARRDTADLFIAVHADAYLNNDAIGASVYALSQHGATSEATRWLARQENYSEIGGIEFDHLTDQSRMVRSVLIDLSQTATIRDSLRLGSKVLGALHPVTPLHYRHVEQAPFVVLKSPDIPSILIETGFISNPREAQQLADPGYQNKLAQAVSDGVKNYINHYAVLSSGH